MLATYINVIKINSGEVQNINQKRIKFNKKIIWKKKFLNLVKISQKLYNLLCNSEPAKVNNIQRKVSVFALRKKLEQFRLNIIQ